MLTCHRTPISLTYNRSRRRGRKTRFLKTFLKTADLVSVSAWTSRGSRGHLLLSRRSGSGIRLPEVGNSRSPVARVEVHARRSSWNSTRRQALPEMLNTMPHMLRTAASVQTRSPRLVLPQVPPQVLVPHSRRNLRRNLRSFKQRHSQRVAKERQAKRVLLQQSERVAWKRQAKGVARKRQAKGVARKPQAKGVARKPQAKGVARKRQAKGVARKPQAKRMTHMRRLNTMTGRMHPCLNMIPMKSRIRRL